MKQNTLITIGIIFFLIAFAWIGWKNLPQNKVSNFPASQGILVAQEKSFDFGEISMAKGIVTHSFTIQNEGKEPVNIGRIYTSCMCTTASLIKKEETFGPYGMLGHGYIPKINTKMEPGEVATVQVFFDPAAHGPAGIGRIQRSITIENDGVNPLVLEIFALVTP